MLTEFGSDCGIVQCAKTMGDQTMLHGVAYSHWCARQSKNWNLAVVLHVVAVLNLDRSTLLGFVGD